jgi:hypothetical protein
MFKGKLLLWRLIGVTGSHPMIGFGANLLLKFQSDISEVGTSFSICDF